MSVFNGEKHLRESVESILNQSFTDFEFLIIDDGSKDSTLEILHSYDDSRIKIIRNSENIGLTKSLNIGLELAKGEYIARMDADDICYPKRLEKQVRFLENNKNIGVLGTSRELINDNNEIIGRVFSTGSSIILKWHSLFGSHGIAHPTVMVRKTLIDMAGGYNPKYTYAQDAELWNKLSMITNFSNLPDILLKYRVNENQISLNFKDEQDNNNLHLLHPILQKYLNKDIDIKNIQKIILLQNIYTEDDLQEVFDNIYFIYTKFLYENNLNREENNQIRSDVQTRFFFLSVIANKISKKMCKKIMKESFLIDPINMISLYIKFTCTCISKKGIKKISDVL